MNHAQADGRLHVLLLPSWYPSSLSPHSGPFFREQALALRDAGMKVGVIAPEIVGLRAFVKAGRPTTAIVREDDSGIPTYRKLAVPLLPQFSRRNAWFWLRAGRALFAAYVRDHGLPDLIHAHSAVYAGLLANEIGRRHDLPYVITEHLSTFAEGRLRRWLRRPVSRAFGSAAARLVVSPQLGVTLTAHFGDAFCPWQTVPNTLDLRFEQPLDDKPPRNPGLFQFLCIGRFRTLKAQDLLIAAFARAFQGDPSVRLRLAGSGLMQPSCRALANELGVAERVDFLGDLDRDSVRRELLAADALAIPSYYETFGVVVIEALACGKPVIATRCGGPEGLIDDTNGLTVPPGDPGLLADALTRMRQQYDSYDPVILRRDCLVRYSRRAVAGQLREKYDSIALNAVDTATRPYAQMERSAVGSLSATESKYSD